MEKWYLEGLPLSSEAVFARDSLAEPHNFSIQIIVDLGEFLCGARMLRLSNVSSPVSCLRDGGDGGGAGGHA